MCEMHASIYIIEQILYSPGTRGTEKKCPLYGIVHEVSAFRSFLNYCISIRMASSGLCNKVAAIWKVSLPL